MKNLIQAAVFALSAFSTAHAQNAVQWKVSDGGNGHWYRRIDTPTRWRDADTFCRYAGGHLLTPTSSAEQHWAWEALALNGANCWIGGSQLPNTCEPGCGWSWITGEPWVYTNWWSVAPDDNRVNGDENCLIANSVGLWDDVADCGSCTERFAAEWDADCNGDYIVDYGQCHDGTLPDYNSNNLPDCCERGEACIVGNYPVQWRAIESGNGHWYAQYGTPVNVSWSSFLAAGNACGGHVVSLSSQQEELFVYRQFGAAVIGLRANSGESSFVWIDDPSNTYSNWGTAFCPSGPYPNNPTTSERFVELQFANCPGSQGLTTKWDDYQSSEWPSSVNIIMEFDADCNNDGIVDYGQILTGQFVDANADGIPDICQQPTCRDADLFRNGVVNGADLGIMLSQWGPAPTGTVSDINRDGLVNGADLGYLLNAWGPCPN